MEEPEWAICQYNRGHQMPIRKLMSHKCPEKKKLEGQFDVCRYHATHVIEKGFLEQHYALCASNTKRDTRVESLRINTESTTTPTEEDKPQSTSDFLDNIDKPSSSDDKECTALPVNMDLNITNWAPRSTPLQQEDLTECRACLNPIDYRVLYCKLCYLRHPQKFTEKDKPKLMRAKNAIVDPSVWNNTKSEKTDSHPEEVVKMDIKEENERKRKRTE